MTILVIPGLRPQLGLAYLHNQTPGRWCSNCPFPGGTVLRANRRACLARQLLPNLCCTSVRMQRHSLQSVGMPRSTQRPLRWHCTRDVTDMISNID